MQFDLKLKTSPSASSLLPQVILINKYTNQNELRRIAIEMKIYTKCEIIRVMSDSSVWMN